MNTALVRKELRELLPLIVVAGLVQLLLVCLAMGMQIGPFGGPQKVIPFVNDTFPLFFLLVACLLGAVIGLWQTSRESRQGTFLFLLHRPSNRQAIFATKLLVGIGACVLMTAIPLLVYILWAARPGTHASPFDWWSALGSESLCLVVPLVYLGAFLSGLRPARWFGSRLFPLWGSLLLLFFTLAPIHWGMDWLFLLICELGYLVAIFFVARTRDFS